MDNEIPPPMKIEQVAPQPKFEATYKPGVPNYSIPFIIAESCRMMLNFLATDSALPNAHRNVIADFVLSHNRVLLEYMTATYGAHGAFHANLIAQAMHAEFIGLIKSSRDEAESELFRLLEEQIGDGESTG